jgi:hypothetical protein
MGCLRYFRFMFRGVIYQHLFISIWCSISVPVVLYRRESFQLREEHRCSMFGNRMLNKMFGPKRNEVT